jgi:hypothetical protein
MGHIVNGGSSNWKTCSVSGGCPPKKSDFNCPTNPNVVIVDQDITENTTWCSNKTFIISAEVHVTAGNTLCIEDGTQVLFRQCPLKNPRSGGVPYATLVIDSGASILAENVGFSAQFNGWQSTGGLIILGTLASGGQFENYSTIVADPNVDPGRSKLSCCTFNYLGNGVADLNALTLFFVKDNSEVELSNISISAAGDDGIEIFGGRHSIDNLAILISQDDAIDLDDNAVLTVTDSLSISKFPAFGDPVGENNGTSLVEVEGGAGTTNVLEISAGASVNMIGRITDKVTGGTTFGGSFTGTVAGEINRFSFTAAPGTFIQGTV